MSIVIALVLLANGLAAGVLMGTQLGGWPLLAALPPDRYVHAHAFFSTRYDPFMPLCLVGTAVGDAALAVLTGVPAARVLFVLAGAGAAATITISITKNVPVNRWMRTLDPDRLPDDFDRRDPRRDWGSWNRIRTGLTVAALLGNCAAVAVLL